MSWHHRWTCRNIRSILAVPRKSPLSGLRIRMGNMFRLPSLLRKDDHVERAGTMAPEHQLTFGPFRLETPQGGLWRGDHLIPLRPRSLAMLRYLAAHPGRLVTKAEVQQHVWAGTHVTPTVLRVCVREIRVALGD